MENTFIDRCQVVKAVLALKVCKNTSAERKKCLDLFEVDRINLQFSYKKIPCMKSRTIKIVLPNSLMKETSEICLFVKDMDQKVRDYEGTIREYKKILKSKGIAGNVEIFPLKKLKLEYNDYEAKKNLSNMFDTYLADARIARLLPAILGKHFISRKKYLTQLRMDSNDLCKHFDSALRTSHCILGGRGPTCQVTVGRTSQTDEEIADNIMVCCEKIAESIPGGKENIRNINIKIEDSLSVPVYISYGSKEEVVLPKKPKVVESMDAEDVSTVLHGKVTVSSLGVVTIVNKASTRRKAVKTGKHPKGKLQTGKRLTGKQPIGKRPAGTQPDGKRVAAKRFRQ